MNKHEEDLQITSIGEADSCQITRPPRCSDDDSVIISFHVHTISDGIVRLLRLLDIRITITCMHSWITEDPPQLRQVDLTSEMEIDFRCRWADSSLDEVSIPSSHDDFRFGSLILDSETCVLSFDAALSAVDGVKEEFLIEGVFEYSG